MIEQTRRPNIIWIFGDQHRAQALGCAGDPNCHTPNLDRLVAHGLYFPNAVSNSPLCGPARGSLLTGRYSHHSVRDNGHGMPDELPTVSDLFREQGYETCYMGKWHVSGKERLAGQSPRRVVPWAQRSRWNRWVGYENLNNQWQNWVHWGNSAEEVQHCKLGGYETDKLTNYFLEYLGERSNTPEKPFFAALSVQPPHDPFVAPSEWMKHHTPGEIKLRKNVPEVTRLQDRARRDLAGYYAMIENLDWNLGRILQKLQDDGLWENTLVFFFSDHGEMGGSQGRFNKSVPYEESIRIPMIISGGGIAHMQDHVVPSPLSLVDLLPTSLGAAGLPVPASLPGFDYSPYLKRRGENPLLGEPDSAYLQLCQGPSEKHATPPWRGIVTRDGWKYVCLPGEPWLLYNLNEDPFETMNAVFISSFFTKRRELHDRLEEWIGKTGDHFPLPTLSR